MSYKLISANDIRYNSYGYVTKDEDAPDINVGSIDKIKSNEELYQEFCKRIWNESEDVLGSDYVEIEMAKGILWKLLMKKQKV